MYFEEFSPGQMIEAPSREIRSDDVTEFIDLSWMGNTLFLSDQGARAAGYTRKLVPGLLVLSMAMGLVQQTGAFDHVMALLEFDHMKFVRSVFHGDTISITTTVKSKRPTANPKRGLVILEYNISNQKKQPVLTTQGAYLIQTQPED
ncbi:MAG: MaoC/PaaZ C-terminal domain-containing protein [Desulfarculaceae bacterium]|jgi:acyl dehydratase